MNSSTKNITNSMLVLSNQVSTNGKPLDFSFKNIQNIKDLKSAEHRQGKRKPYQIEQEENQDENKNNEMKQKQQAKQDQDEKVEAANQEEGMENDPENKEENENPLQIEKPGIEIVRFYQPVNTQIHHHSSVHQEKQIQLNQSVKVINEEETKTSLKKVVKVTSICTTLILSYNQIRSLDGRNFFDTINSIVLSIKNLAWIDLSHNYLTHINYDFSDFYNLKTLYLHANYISKIEELKIIKAPNLKQFTIHGNPLETIPGFRLMIIYIFPQLKRLDTVVVSKKELDNANFLIRSNPKFKFPEVVNPMLPPEVQVPQDQKNKN